MFEAAEISILIGLESTQSTLSPSIEGEGTVLFVVVEAEFNGQITRLPGFPTCSIGPFSRPKISSDLSIVKGEVLAAEGCSLLLLFKTCKRELLVSFGWGDHRDHLSKGTDKCNFLKSRPQHPSRERQYDEL